MVECEPPSICHIYWNLDKVPDQQIESVEPTQLRWKAWTCPVLKIEFNLLHENWSTRFMDSAYMEEEFICTETIRSWVYEPNIYKTMAAQV